MPKPMMARDRNRKAASMPNRPAGCAKRRQNPSARARFAVPDELLGSLRETLMSRRLQEGIDWFQDHLSFLEGIDPEHPNAAVLVAYVAQLIDLRDGTGDILRRLLELFSQPTRCRLALNAYAHLRLADGIVAWAEQALETAVTHFNFVISIEQEPIDQELAALAHFWKAQCEHRRGDYDAALTHAGRGRLISLKNGRLIMAAAIQTLEARLHVEKGRHGRAGELLREAAALLETTQDFIGRGTIQAALGRIAAEEGRYQLATEHFVSALGHFREGVWRDRQVVETLTNLALCQRLISTRLAKAIDTSAERRRRSALEGQSSPTPCARHDVEELRQQALMNLTAAIEMCGPLRESRGQAFALIERGFLCLDGGHYDEAAADASAAYALGSAMTDYAVMASACLLLSKKESVQYEEGIGDAPAQYAQRAHDFAKEAVTYALEAEDRRILAHAYICQGLILANDFFNNPEAASECCLQASQLLTAGQSSQLWDEHQALARKVARKSSVHEKLGEWSRGLVDGKTFQQVTEEFADLVIPTVWEREGRNVSRVVAKLFISPKKVRRILTRAGFKPGIESC